MILLTNLGEAEPDVFADAIAAAINPKLGLPSQPLKDQEDAIGKRVRALIAGLAGTRSPPRTSLFCRPATSRPWPRITRNSSRHWVNWRAFSLVERHERGDDRWYRWRAAFKEKALEVTLSLAPNDKVSWFYLKPVSD